MKGGGRGVVRYGKPTNLQLLHAVLSRICIIICVIYGFASEFWFSLSVCYFWQAEIFNIIGEIKVYCMGEQLRGLRMH